MSIRKKSLERHLETEELIKNITKEMKTDNVKTKMNIKKILKRYFDKYGVKNSFSYVNIRRHQKQLYDEIKQEIRDLSLKNRETLFNGLFLTTSFGYLYQKYIYSSELGIDNPIKQLSKSFMFGLIDKKINGKTIIQRINENATDDYNRLIREIKDGIVRGETLPKMNSIVDVRMNKIKRHNDIIATTEGLRTSSTSLELVNKEVDITLIKEWDATLDNKTREDHVTLDGQRVKGKDGLFKVNGDKAKYPRQFGKASQDVNCRCITLIYPKGYKNESEYRAKNKITKDDSSFKQWAKSSEIEGKSNKEIASTTIVGTIQLS